MIPSLENIQDARAKIQKSAIRTPLVRLNFPEVSTEIYLKLENLQPIGSFKIRGAANAMTHLSAEKLKSGVLTASAGNMAQGVAWCARELGIPCTVIAPETAPNSKVQAIERLGGRVIKVPFEEWWKTFENRAYDGVRGTFIHAFDDPHVIAANGTIGLEIFDDLPDVGAVIVPWGGGGLACGIAAAMRYVHPKCRVYAAEVETATPLTSSLAAGSPQIVNYQPSIADGMGAKTVFQSMFAMAKELIQGTIVADLEQLKTALRLLVERNHVVAKGAGACSVACALKGSAASGKIVCIVSGGNSNTDVLCSVLQDS